MRKRFYNARVLSMTDKKIFEGELWVKDNYIEYIGPQIRSNDEKFDSEIDIRQNLIMPGLKNAHTHSAMTFARSYADGYPLNEWLSGKILPMESRLKKEHYYIYSLLACMEYFSSGITANFDMYYEPEEIVRASIECGMRTVLCGAINNFKESVEELESNYLKYNEYSELISYILGFHAEYTTDGSMILDVGKLANKYKAPVYVHNSETHTEVENCIKKYGKTPTKLFEESGIYCYGGGGFHCVYLNDEDINIFMKNDLYAIINSCSNLKLASGIAPVYNYMKRGMNIAIGTDGAASNNALDIFREMYVTTITQSLIDENAINIPPYEILKLATINSAKAMGLKDSTTLEKEKKADFIVIDLSMANMQPENNIISNLIYSCGKHNVVMTVIDGVIVYDYGDFKTIDKEQVIHYANQFLQDLC